MQNLDRCFFDSLVNVTRLSLLGDANACLGAPIKGHKPEVPLRLRHMPKLKELELSYCFIEDRLVAFLAAHSDTLEVGTCYLFAVNAAYLHTLMSLFRRFLCLKPDANNNNSTWHYTTVSFPPVSKAMPCTE